MDEEKRLYRRVDVECRAQGVYLKPSSERFSAMVVSIGPEGVGFTADKALDIDRSITLSIDIGGG